MDYRKYLGKMIAAYSIKNDRKIKSICRTLAYHLDIPFFTYFRIDKNGGMISLGNHGEQCVHYHEEGHFLRNPYFTHPDLIRPGCLIANSTHQEDYIEIQRQYEYRFNMFHGFMIIEKNEKALEGYYFSISSNNSDIYYHYMNNLDHLKQFGRYFAREAAPLIRKMSLEGLNIKDAKGQFFLERDKTLPLSCEDLRLEKFLEEISPLSPQERKCLEFFRKGNSAQATAAKMGISNRTVEHYFESIKIKLNCSSKWDLLNT